MHASHNDKGTHMSSTFKTIGIIGRVKNPKVKETLSALIHYLLTLSQTILVEAETAASLNDPTLPTIERDHIGKQCDLLIVVGGDGSLLHAAHAIANDETPVLG